MSTEYNKSLSVPEIRIKTMNKCMQNQNGHYVLYWMITARRLTYNFALQRSLEYAVHFNKPLFILEALRMDYQYSSDRFHRFIIDGIQDNMNYVKEVNNPGVFFYPYVEMRKREGAGLLLNLAEHACVVITDNYPCFFVPNMIKKAASILNVYFEMVDSNGLLPLAATNLSFKTALSFRAFLQKNLKPYLTQLPIKEPLLVAKIPIFDFPLQKIFDKWPIISSNFFSRNGSEFRSLEIDHSVPSVNIQGGSIFGQKLILEFIKKKLDNYIINGNNPELDCRSNLSPYLHFGHVSVYEVFEMLANIKNWSTNKIGKSTNGRKGNWWGMGEEAENWLDELITWRELGFNLTNTTIEYDKITILPPWAIATLQKHKSDKRESVYTVEKLTAGETNDPVWNIAQKQLLNEGRIHSYLRMVWGKKILEWSSTPEDALETLLHLNNKYALDGRDPNSYTGCLWILGMFDRPWGPERPIFGTVRYMSSENTIKKFKLKNFIERVGGVVPNQNNKCTKKRKNI